MASNDREAVMEAVVEAMYRGETVDSAAKAQGVASGTVRQWFARDEAWRVRYREARLMQGQAMAEEAVRIAREATNYSTAADKLLIETLKWAAAKANPAEYGEKQTVEHQGSQQLHVKIVEEDGLPKRVRAVESAVEHALITSESSVGVIHMLPATGKNHS